MVVARKQQQCKQRVYLRQANQETLIFILANHERELNQAGEKGPSVRRHETATSNLRIPIVKDDQLTEDEQFAQWQKILYLMRYPGN